MRISYRLSSLSGLQQRQFYVTVFPHANEHSHFFHKLHKLLSFKPLSAAL